MTSVQLCLHHPDLPKTFLRRMHRPLFVGPQVATEGLSVKEGGRGTGFERRRGSGSQIGHGQSPPPPHHWTWRWSEMHNGLKVQPYGQGCA